jgi:iron-sulfur cluster assembly accessory protein
MENVAIDSPIAFSESAIAELKRLVEKHEDAAQSIRVGVKGGGCSGMTYVLEFDNEQTGDVTLNIDGVKVFLNPSHELYLHGMEVDFGSGLNDRGFTFKNPNASKTCGCGTSFSV